MDEYVPAAAADRSSVPGLRLAVERAWVYVLRSKHSGLCCGTVRASPILPNGSPAVPPKGDHPAPRQWHRARCGGESSCAGREFQKLVGAEAAIGE